MREFRHNDPSLFKGYVHLHNLQDAPRLHTGKHTLNANNNKTQGGEKPVFFTLQIHLRKLSVQLFAILLINLATVALPFSHIVNRLFIINSIIYFSDIINR